MRSIVVIRKPTVSERGALLCNSFSFRDWIYLLLLKPIVLTSMKLLAVGGVVGEGISSRSVVVPSPSYHEEAMLNASSV
eukprot:1073302-Ditylum_brightwellii.AAC.1